MRRLSRLSFAGGLTAAGAATMRPARAAEPIQFKIGHDFEPEHPVGVGANQLADAVKRESNGRLVINVFPNSLLGGSTSIISQVRLGAVQMYLLSGAVLSAAVPVAGIERLGFAFPNRRSVLAAMDGDLGNYIRAQFTPAGMTVFERIWDVGFRQVTTRVKPIANADDFVGLRIRVPGGAIGTDFFKALGASPATLDAKELYPALQTHVVDSFEGSFSNVLGYKMYELQKCVSVTNHQWGGLWLIANTETYRALPLDLQGILRRLANGTADRERALAERDNLATAEKLKSLGMRVASSDTSSMRAKLTDYYTRWKSTFGPTAWGLMEKYSGKLG